MRVGIENGLCRVALRERLGSGLAVGVILSATVLGEVGALVDDGSALNN